MTQTLTAKHPMPRHAQIAMAMVCLLSIALFTSVALINIAVLGLVLVAPFAWRDFLKTKQEIGPDAKLFLGLVLALCMWDVCTNVLAGFGLGAALKELLHDLRTLGFVLLLWAVFVNPRVARVAFWTFAGSVLVLGSLNLLFTLTGYVAQGEYFTTGHLRMSHMSHMYGQALVGLVFVLAQMWLVRPQLAWRVAVPLVLLVASLFLASERRTGWLLMAAGFGVWGLLNAKRLFVGKYKWLLLLAVAGVIGVVATSDVVHRRMVLAAVEFGQYLSMTPQERSAAVLGAVSLRMQYAATAWEAIQQSNWWVGVGSIAFPQVYQAAATTLEVTPQSWAGYNWGNPHNEYLYMLATKGVVGLALYLAIFAQACRMAWGMKDEVQRIGLVMFVFLFMLSITTNSMMVDMEEGHFTLLILLVFLAPKSLDLVSSKFPDVQKEKLAS
jgi:O-antigen ligase